VSVLNETFPERTKFRTLAAPLSAGFTLYGSYLITKTLNVCVYTSAW